MTTKQTFTVTADSSVLSGLLASLDSKRVNITVNGIISRGVYLRDLGYNWQGASVAYGGRYGFYKEVPRTLDDVLHRALGWFSEDAAVTAIEVLSDQEPGEVYQYDEWTVLDPDDLED